MQRRIKVRRGPLVAPYPPKAIRRRIGLFAGHGLKQTALLHAHAILSNDRILQQPGKDDEVI